MSMPLQMYTSGIPNTYMWGRCTRRVVLIALSCTISTHDIHASEPGEGEVKFHVAHDKAAAAPRDQCMDQDEKELKEKQPSSLNLFVKPYQVGQNINADPVFGSLCYPPGEIIITQQLCCVYSERSWENNIYTPPHEVRTQEHTIMPSGRKDARHLFMHNGGKTAISVSKFGRLELYHKTPPLSASSIELASEQSDTVPHVAMYREELDQYRPDDLFCTMNRQGSILITRTPRGILKYYKLAEARSGHIKQTCGALNPPEEMIPLFFLPWRGVDIHVRALGLESGTLYTWIPDQDAPKADRIICQPGALCCMPRETITRVRLSYVRHGLQATVETSRNRKFMVNPKYTNAIEIVSPKP